MQADKTTLNDLSIFQHEEEQSVCHHLNFTKTVGGKDWLRLLLSRPLLGDQVQWSGGQPDPQFAERFTPAVLPVP